MFRMTQDSKSHRRAVRGGQRVCDSKSHRRTWGWSVLDDNVMFLDTVSAWRALPRGVFRHNSVQMLLQ